MPKVAGKHYAYTKKGKAAAKKAAAKKAAAKSGKKVQYGTTTKRRMAKK